MHCNQKLTLIVDAADGLGRGLLAIIDAIGGDPGGGPLDGSEES